MTKIFTDKEAEAIMWAASQIGDYAHDEITDDRHPVAVMRRMGFSNFEIATAGDTLETVAADRTIPPPPVPSLVAAALRLAVENTSWIECYRTAEPTKNSPAHINEALAALRSLATKLEDFGIIINHIPFD